TVSYGPLYRTAAVLYEWFRLPFLLAQMTAHRFEILLAQRLVLRDVCEFVDSRIRRIHGRRVADLLRDLVDRRIEVVDTALEGLKLQYPGYAEEVERLFIERISLRIEAREYEAIFDDGLIGAELYSVLMQDVATKRAAAEARPPLDVTPQRIELVQRLPVFADVDQPTLRRLSRALRTRHADAGEIIIARDTPARSVFFIASGAVELEVAGQSWRLGRGEIFGQSEILSRQHRRPLVRAIAPSMLLVLDEARFRRLLARNRTVREAVVASAAARGFDLEPFLQPGQ
ncbi:MAG: cyclic nucleotide-binding domain-containing protein, partial [Roseobacter sp.]